MRRVCWTLENTTAEILLHLIVATAGRFFDWLVGVRQLLATSYEQGQQLLPLIQFWGNVICKMLPWNQPPEIDW